MAMRHSALSSAVCTCCTTGIFCSNGRLPTCSMAKHTTTNSWHTARVTVSPTNVYLVVGKQQVEK
jgi:hypothetical protein